MALSAGVNDDMSPYRVGVIGCGSIGRAHAYGWTNSERTELVALADITPAARDEFGEEFGVQESKRYADFREMLDKEKPDIVSVCLWHGQHASTVIAVAAPPTAEADRLREADGDQPRRGRADDRGGRAQQGQARRSGTSGGSCQAGTSRATWSPRGPSARPRHLWSNVADGLLNWGTHTIDMMRFIMGDPSRDGRRRRGPAPLRPLRARHAHRGLLPRADPVRERRPGHHPERPDGPRETASINCNFYGTEGVIQRGRERRQADERHHERLEADYHL